MSRAYIVKIMNIMLIYLKATGRVPVAGVVIGILGLYREILSGIHEVKLDVIVLRKDSG